jgi:endonuclease/exonuclease/phosphatase (EEP) superfamily protein YafD
MAGGRRRRRLDSRLLHLAVYGYALAALAVCVAIQFLVDRVWLATLAGFGPRGLTALPLLPLAGWAMWESRRERAWSVLGALALTAGVLLVGILDLRLGLGRASGAADLRLMTWNVGPRGVSAEALDALLRRNRVDVAALQECPYFDLAPLRFGWKFFYGGDLCLVSRFPFTVLDVADPDSLWKHSGRQPIKFRIESPVGSFHLLNVHLPTIREGLEGLAPQTRSSFAANRVDAWQQSASARARVSDPTVPLIVAGDFNLPVESAIYRASWGDLTNAFSTCGRGFGRTKFTGAFGIRIDHVLASTSWECTDASVLLPADEGDHAPLVVALRRR